MNTDYCNVLLKATFPGMRLFLALIKFSITLVICYSSPKICGWKKDRWKKNCKQCCVDSKHCLEKSEASFGFWITAYAAQSRNMNSDRVQMLKAEHLVMKSHRLVCFVDKEKVQQIRE